MHELSICIVNWNVRELLKACLNSIFNNTKGISFEVIVVDNASSDGSVDMVRKEFPQVKLIANGSNAGFTRANNQALKIAQGRYVMFLNPDTELKGNSLATMVNFMHAHKDCAALGPKLLNSDGSLQRSCKTFPSLISMLFNALFLDSIFPRSKVFGGHFMAWWDFNHTREVDQPMGSALMVKKEVLDSAGWFDENIFIWFDEVDLCYRIKKAGWKIYFTPDAQIIHHLSRSFKQWKSITQVLNGALMWRISRNYFFRKHKGNFSVVALICLDLIQIALVIAILSIPYFLVKSFLLGAFK